MSRAAYEINLTKSIKADAMHHQKDKEKEMNKHGKGFEIDKF